MDEVRFWQIVQAVHDDAQGDMDEKCSRLSATLSKLSKPDAIEFARIFDSLMVRAYAWPLWGAAYIIQGGCGDDAFTDFRASLISRGQISYEQALSDPESLAGQEIDEGAWFFEGYQYAVTEGVEAAAGEIVDRMSHVTTRPSGTEWTEDEVYELFPKLSRKFM